MPASDPKKARAPVRRGPHRDKVDRRLKRIAASLQASSASAGGGLPKYRLLHNALLDAIESGIWKPGERLPSEAVIAGMLPLSLGTVQRAFQSLVDQGVVTRHHGQGSFVAGLPVNANQIRNFRFLDDDGKRLLPVYGRVLSVESIEEAGPWSTFLPGEQRFVRISRLINVNLEFQTFSQVYLPEVRFGDLLKVPSSSISVPLTYMLSERFNAPTLHVTHTVACERLSEEACSAIGQPAGSVGMHWEIFSYSYRNLPSFYQRVFLPLTNRRLQFPEVG